MRRIAPERGNPISRRSEMRCWTVLLLTCCGVTSLPLAAQGEALEALVLKAHQEDRFHGVVLAAREGSVVYQGAFGLADRAHGVPHKLTTRFPIFGVTKLWTSVLVARAFEEGLLTSDGSVGDVLPAFKVAGWQKMHFGHLLRHRSGLPGSTELINGFTRSEVPTLEAAVARAAAASPSFAPGKAFSYSHTDYLVLQHVLEQVHGLSYEELVTERVLRPGGLKGAGLLAPRRLVPHLARGHVRLENGWGVAQGLDAAWLGGAGAGYASAPDLLAFDRALRDDRLLGPEARARFLSPAAEGRGYVADGHWIYDLQLADGQTVRISERRGYGDGFAHLFVRGLEEDWCLVVLANAHCPGLHDLNHRRGLAHELLSALLSSREASKTSFDPLLGRWKVTLFTGGEAASGSTEMVISNRDERRIEGSFYGSAFEQSWCITGPGFERIAFVTSDASSTYFHVGTRRGRLIEGFTLCPDRDLLARWTAEP